MAALGVSIGDTRAAVAISKDGVSDVIANDMGERTTPSVVSYGEEQVSVGLAAFQQILKDPKNTAKNFLSLVGQKFEDAAKDTHGCALEAKDGMAYIKPERLDEAVAPEDLVGLVMKQLVDTGTGQIGNSEGNIVLARPPSAQHMEDMIISTAKKHGIKISGFIPEPLAAALAYQDVLGVDSDHLLLIYDLGASKATVSAVQVNGGSYRLIDYVEDSSIGGKDFDKGVLNFLKKEFQKKTKIDISDDKKAMNKLELAAVEAKHILATKPTAPVAVESLFDGADFTCKLTRVRVDVALASTYRKCPGPITKLLEKTGLEISQFTKVILAGGATKAPKLQSTLNGFLNSPGIILNSITPDEVIAIGAAKQGSLLADPTYTAVDEDLTLPTTSKEISLQSGSGEVKKLIGKGAPIPAKRETQINFPASEEQASLAIVEVDGTGAEPVVLARMKLPVFADESLITVSAQLKMEGLDVTVKNGEDTLGQGTIKMASA
eukprot:m.334608 g.334608  ORF g.334608 m.334608 type:complete len:492 (-) comp17397_c0_seq1:1287-2762(-)